MFIQQQSEVPGYSSEESVCFATDFHLNAHCSTTDHINIEAAVVTAPIL
jgi:hypothetical protein